jgi:hypothetical protein
VTHATVRQLCVVLLLLASASAAAQPGHPTVVMSIAAPGGKPQEISARESGLATIKVKGTEYGFRPTIDDSKPWNKVRVAVFKMTPTSELLGEVQLTTGAAAVASKTQPVFRIAVVKVHETP